MSFRGSSESGWGPSHSSPTLPFGKFKGWPLDEAFARDPRYCAWLCTQPWFQRRFSKIAEELDWLVSNTPSDPTQSHKNLRP